MKYSLYPEIKSVWKIFTRAVIGFAVGSIIYIACVFLVWTLYPYKTAEIVEPMKVLNENHIVRGGEPLALELSINKQSDITPSVSRNVVCRDTIYFVDAPQSGGRARPKGQYTATVTFNLPTIPVGEECYFQFTNSYQVNLLRTINKVWKSELFKIGD